MSKPIRKTKPTKTWQGLLKSCKNNVASLETEIQYFKDEEADRIAKKEARSKKARARRAANKLRPKKVTPKATAAKPNVILVDEPEIVSSDRAVAEVVVNEFDDALENAPPYIMTLLKKEIIPPRSSRRSAGADADFQDIKIEERGDEPSVSRSVKITIPTSIQDFMDEGVIYFSLIDQMPSTDGDQEEDANLLFFAENNMMKEKQESLLHAANKAIEFIERVKEQAVINFNELIRVPIVRAGKREKEDRQRAEHDAKMQEHQRKDLERRRQQNEEYSAEHIPRTEKALLLVQAFLAFMSASDKVAKTKTGAVNKAAMKKLLVGQGFSPDVIKSLLDQKTLLSLRDNSWTFKIGNQTVKLHKLFMDDYRDMLEQYE